VPVDDAIKALQSQSALGRGTFQLSVRPIRLTQPNLQPLVVTGLPAEAGDVVAIFAITDQS